MRRWSINSLKLQIGFATIVAFVCLLSINALSPWRKDNDHLAGWAQGIGALAAIGAAYVIATESQRAAASMARQSHDRLLTGADATAAWAAKLVTDMDGPLFGPEAPRAQWEAIYRPSDFEAALRALRGIPLHEIGDLDLVRALLGLETAIAAAAQQFALVTVGNGMARNIPAIPNLATGVINARESVRLRLVQLRAESFSS